MDGVLGIRTWDYSMLGADTAAPFLLSNSGTPTAKKF